MWFFKKRKLKKKENQDDQENFLFLNEEYEKEVNPSKEMEAEALEEYEIVEREIVPESIICPDCGGITLRGLEFCDKCGGELSPK